MHAETLRDSALAVLYLLHLNLILGPKNNLGSPVTLIICAKVDASKMPEHGYSFIGTWVVSIVHPSRGPTVVVEDGVAPRQDASGEIIDIAEAESHRSDPWRVCSTIQVVVVPREMEDDDVVFEAVGNRGFVIDTF